MPYYSAVTSFAKIPLIKAGESFPPYFFARSTASLIATFSGTSVSYSISYKACRRIVSSTLPIRRVFQLPEDFDGMAFDIGWGEFDHHQSGAPVRENGVPYAAFGLLWREFGASILGRTEAQRLDERFIQPIDLDDNTGCGGALPDLIADFNPLWDSGADPDQRFLEAVELAQKVLQNRLDSVLATGRAYRVVKAAMKAMEDHIVVLDVYCPWKPFVTKGPARFVVYPSQRGGWSGQCVPFPAEQGGSLKQPFPAQWAGKTAGELAALTGIPTLRFCHNNRFLVAAQTMEDARAACLLALEEAKKRNEQYRTFQHDINNHFLVLSGLIREKRYEEAEIYLDKLHGSSDRLLIGIETGNPILDILLQEKISFAVSSGIEVKHDVQIPPDCGEEDMDLCMILANALDNAVHACRKVAGRQPEISVMVRRRHHFLIIEVVNTMVQAQGRLEYGTGLNNIRRTAEKYEGTMEIENDGETFRLTVLLCLAPFTKAG